MKQGPSLRLNSSPYRHTHSKVQKCPDRYFSQQSALHLVFFQEYLNPPLEAVENAQRRLNILITKFALSPRGYTRAET